VSHRGVPALSTARPGRASAFRMSLVRRCLLAGAGVLGLLGCSGGSGTSSTGPGGAGGSVSSTVASTSGAGGAPAGTGGASSTGGAPSTSATGGSGGSESPVVPSGFTCSGAKPSITAVAQITAKNCSAAACHSAMATANGLYQMMVDRIAEECTDNRLMVKPGDPEHSYMIQKVTDHNLCASEPPMPLTGAPLASADIQVIYDWICEGAPDH
jgi:hypothetical protein